MIDTKQEANETPEEETDGAPAGGEEPAPEVPSDGEPAVGAAEEASDPAMDEPAADDVVEPQEEDLGTEASPEERIEILEAKVSDLNDRLLRSMAETENVRRRAQRDKADASKYAIASFAKEMLAVADNMSRALQSMDQEARKTDAALDGLAVGIEMVERELVNTFERFGIKKIEAMGARFDHNLHEAMYEIPDADKSAGTVAHVVEPGFVLHGRLLRPAKVGVTKGGPKPEPAAKEAEEAPKQADAHGREGQAAYESKGDEAGSHLDEEL